MISNTMSMLRFLFLTMGKKVSYLLCKAASRIGNKIFKMATLKKQSFLDSHIAVG
jgi:hypothetical protein